jgi:hypothetical protein
MRLLRVDDAEQPAGVGAHLLDVGDPVQILLSGGLDHVPRRLLRAVVVIGDRSHHVARERVDGALELGLLVTQTEIHRALPGG